MSKRPADLSHPWGKGTEAATGSRSTRKPPANALEAAAARAIRVAGLREAIAAGVYRPDPRRVAEALLRKQTRRALFGDDH